MGDMLQEPLFVQMKLALFADKVDSPFRHKTGDSLSSAVAKTISEMWDGKLIKDEYIATVD